MRVNSKRMRFPAMSLMLNPLTKNMTIVRKRKKIEKNINS